MKNKNFIFDINLINFFNSFSKYLNWFGNITEFFLTLIKLNIKFYQINKLILVVPIALVIFQQKNKYLMWIKQ